MANKEVNTIVNKTKKKNKFTQMYASMLPSLLNMKTENLTNSGYDDGFLLEENILQMMGELKRAYGV